MRVFTFTPRMKTLIKNYNRYWDHWLSYIYSHDGFIREYGFNKLVELNEEFEEEVRKVVDKHIPESLESHNGMDFRIEDYDDRPL